MFYGRYKHFSFNFQVLDMAADGFERISVNDLPDVGRDIGSVAGQGHADFQECIDCGGHGYGTPKSSGKWFEMQMDCQ